MTNRNNTTVDLLDRDRPAVDALVRVCREADGVEPAFFLDAPRAHDRAITGFGVYDRHELVGFAHLPDDPEPEAGVIVRPEARRRGIGRTLVAAMRAEARRRGLGAFLLVNNAESAAGGAWLAALGTHHEFSEYRLEHRADLPLPAARRYPNLVLAEASPADAETLARIRAAAFGDDLAETREEIGRRFAETNRRFFLGVLAGEPIGLLRTGAWPDGADITSFGVLPARQGRGYGRQMLQDAVARLRSEGWARITIEVATDNEHALGLYRSCGFAVMARYDYHRLTV
jgi:ribosomal protein S18 acetylase RimI-like enzyme